MEKITSIEDGNIAISEMRAKIGIFENKDWSKETGISKTLLVGNIISAYADMALAMGIEPDKMLLASLATKTDEIHIVVSLLREMTDDIEVKLNKLLSLRDDILSKIKHNDGKVLTRFDLYIIIRDAYITKEKRRAEYLGIDFNQDYFSRQGNIVAVKTTNYFYHNLKDLADVIIFKEFDDFM